MNVQEVRTTSDIAVTGCVLMRAVVAMTDDFCDQADWPPFDRRTQMSILGNAGVAHDAFVHHVEFGEPIPYRSYDSVLDLAADLKRLGLEIAGNTELCCDTTTRELFSNVAWGVTWHAENSEQS